MAFALTGFKCDGVRYSGPTRQHVKQVAKFYITAANTDVDLDISDSGGTFWTAAQANATYGSLAATALANLALLVVNVDALVGVTSEALVAYLRTASAGSANEYAISSTVTGHLPDITFHSGDAPTSQVLILEWSLVDGAEAFTCDLGTTITV